MTGYGLLEVAVASGSAGGVFGAVMVAVRWTANFMAGRLDIKAAQVDAGMTELLANLKSEIKRLDEDCDQLREMVAQHGRELLECRRKHAESEAEVLKLKALIDARGEIRQRAQLIVAHEKRKAKEQ